MRDGMKVLLIDEHAAFRQALARVLEDEPGVASVAEAGTIAQARELRDHVDICLTELRLPDGSALDLIPELLLTGEGLPILVLTGTADELLMARAVEAGAVGLLHKQAALGEVLDALRRLGRGDRLIDGRRMRELVQLARIQRQRDKELHQRIDSLTARERDVLGALVEGLSDKEVAGRLQISVDTVRTHLVNLFGKLQVESRLQAVIFALRHGLAQLH
jgi:DNA-binding NarL/FixJ family response regulator